MRKLNFLKGRLSLFFFSSRNMYEGPMDKDNGRGRGGLNMGGVGRAGHSNGGKWGQL